jgi:glycosyltransferase involved in cell wall biosynthesis
MAVVSNANLESPQDSGTPRAGAAPAAATRVFVPLVTPYLYGMERAVIELFDSLRPTVEPYFLQSNRIFQRQPPIIREMTRRGFSIQLLPDDTDWERLAKPRSFKHLCQMVAAAVRSNSAIFKGARGKDVLYVPSISAGSGSLLAAVVYRITGRRVIHHFHDLDTNNRLFSLWIPLVTDFVHNTEFGFQDIVKKLPAIKRKRNFIAPPIVEVAERLPDDFEVCRELRETRNLIFVGQVSRHKGVDLLLEAFKLIAPKHPDVVLQLVGGYRDDFRRELDREIATAGLSDRVKFWGFREDSTSLMRFAHTYVHTSPPSRCHESFGRSVVEAMAHGVPTVCFRSGALQEIVVCEKTGLLCDESPYALGIAMDRFLSDVDLRNDCGRNARERYQERYSAQVVRQRWAAFFGSSIPSSSTTENATF